MRGQETTHPNLGATVAGLTSSPSLEPSSLLAGAGDTGDAGVARAPAIGMEIRFMQLNRLTGEGTVHGKASRITTNSQSPNRQPGLSRRPKPRCRARTNRINPPA